MNPPGKPPGPAPMTERILSTADRLFYRHGIRAVGVDAIAAEAGISKRSLYDYFPSKEQLILAYLDRRVRPTPPGGRPPVEQILGVFDRLEHVLAEESFRGCPFVNAVVEHGESPAVADAARRYKEGREAWFRDRLAEAGLADPAPAALQLAVLVDGAIAVALVRRDPAAAGAAGAAARTLLAAAGLAVA